MKLAPHTIRDRVAFSCRGVTIKEPTFRVINALQDLEPDVQIEALFMAATILSTSIGLDPHDLIVRARRILNETDIFPNAHLDAVRDYAGELK
jgi:hypothetical protein